MDDIFICAGVIGSMVVFFGFIIMMRYIKYKETLKLAEKGLVRPPRGRQQRNGKSALRWGIVITALGLALVLGLWPFGALSRHTSYPLGFGPWMLVGLLPLFFGLGLVLIYVLVDKGSKEQQEEGPEFFPPLPVQPILEDEPVLISDFDADVSVEQKPAAEEAEE